MSTPPVKFPKPKRNSGKPPVRKGDGNGNGPTPGPGGDQNWRGLLLLFTAAVAIVALYFAIVHPGMAQEDISQARLFELIKAGKVETIVNEPDPSTGLRMLTGTYKRPVSGAPNAAEMEASFRVPVDLQFNPYLENEIKQAGYTKIIETQASNNWLWQMVSGMLPVVFLVGIFYFLFRQQIRMAGKSAFSFGKSKARMMTRDRNKVTFKDVAGIDEAKEELSEIVEFLKDPRRSRNSADASPRASS